MKYQDSHPSDQQLLLVVEGDLPPNAARSVRAHIDSCWSCRARRHDLEGTIVDFVRLHQVAVDAKLPPVAGPRALLKAHLAQISAAKPRSLWSAFAGQSRWPLAAATAILVAAGFLLVGSGARHTRRSHLQTAIVSIPDSRLTPGAAILASSLVVCSQPNTKNKSVPVALQHQVFEEYGIVGAEPRAYEVDYLVTPALGGADDIRNLWPHSYSATEWNAQVKDALEDRLRDMVCAGSLDLSLAQSEIAENWIAAYKKYFHTDRPLAQHYRPESSR